MATILVPGQPITSEQGFLRGHGTYFCIHNAEDEKSSSMLTSSVAGELHRVNRLISVHPLRSRFAAEVGDLIIGRITSVESKRWKVDIGAQREAVLQLSSVTLPGGEQRMKTYEDQLQMRSLFCERDLICAEVQSVSSEGIINLHTRSLRYGKLENGQLVVVSSHYVKRLPQHYVSLSEVGMDIILGKNGYIWITRTVNEQWQREAGIKSSEEAAAPQAETLQNLKIRHANTPLTRDSRQVACRIVASIRSLTANGFTLSPEIILHVYNSSIRLGVEVKDMLRDDLAKIIVNS